MTLVLGPGALVAHLHWLIGGPGLGVEINYILVARAVGKSKNGQKGHFWTCFRPVFSVDFFEVKLEGGKMRRVYE